jgi:hypothetical protein
MLRRSLYLVALTASVCALVLWLLPSGAPGSVEPVNDNFLDSVNLNTPHTPLNSRATLDDIKDTVGATLQSNIFAPCGISNCRTGPKEVSSCQGVPYGRTVWYDFYPDHNGQVEIRTVGIPNVIALYTYDVHSLLPQKIQCASGSRYGSNELFAKVQRGVDYTFQIGGRDGQGGSLKMLFNYAHRSDLTVAPFFTSAGVKPVDGLPGELKVVSLRFIGLTDRETVSVGCAFCLLGAFRPEARQGNTVVLSASSPPVIGSRSRVVVGATSPAQIGRFKIYRIDVTHPRAPWPVIDQGCLAPGVTSVTGAAAGSPSVLDTVPCPISLLNPAGGEYAFWRGRSGGLWEKWYGAGRWSGALMVRARGLGSGPAVAVHANGEQDVFWRGGNGALWETWYTGAWQGPIPLQVGKLGSAPAVGVDAAGNEYVFWEGMRGGLREAVYSGGGWSAPLVLNARGLGSAPAVAVQADGEQDVFWRGRDGNLWETSYTNGWSAPVNRGVGQLGSGPSVGVDAAGNEYVFWQGARGGLWESSHSGESWSQPVPLDAGRLGSGPAVAVHANGQQDVFWKGSNGDLRETWYTGTWNGPVDLNAAQLGSPPAVGVDAAGKQSGG